VHQHKAFGGCAPEFVRSIHERPRIPLTAGGILIAQELTNRKY
jgi:glycerol-3-phosphate responsive antiterminator